MRHIKFKGVFKVRDNGYYSEDEKNYIESKRHEILSISIGSHCTIAYQDTVMTVFEMQCSNYDILQFTGLVDRNGKEIYEGDVLEYDTGKRYIVVYSTEGLDSNTNDFYIGAFMLKDDRNFHELICSVTRPYRYAEIIGNIHENPELLNEKQ